MSLFLGNTHQSIWRQRDINVCNLQTFHLKNYIGIYEVIYICVCVYIHMERERDYESVIK